MHLSPGRVLLVCLCDEDFRDAALPADPLLGARTGLRNLLRLEALLVAPPQHHVIHLAHVRGLLVGEHLPLNHLAIVAVLLGGVLKEAASTTRRDPLGIRADPRLV